MREHTEGFEWADQPENGWTSLFSTGNRLAGSGNQNLDVGGNGGDYYYNSGNVHRLQSPDMQSVIAGPTAEIREGFFRAYIYTNNDGWMAFSQGGNRQLTVLFDTSAGTIQIRRGTNAGTLLATSVATVTTSVWHRFEVHYFSDQTTGFVRVYVDDPGDYSSPIVEYTGDTCNEATEGFTRVEVGGSVTTRLDDLAVNSISIRFDNLASGTPAAGDAITWPGGGSAEVSGYIDRGSNAGTLIVHTSNHRTNPISDNDEITDGTWTADAVVPNGTYEFGMEPQSYFPGEGFVIYKEVDGDVSGQIQLTGTDGDSTNNYLLVDDNAVDTTTEGVISDTDGFYDIYESSSSLPATANSINHVDLIAYALKDGSTINYLNGRVRISSTNYDSDAIYDRNVSSSADQYRFPFESDPSGPDTAWTVSAINALEFGIRTQA